MPYPKEIIDNLKIIRSIAKYDKTLVLADDEYFALMVTDTDNFGFRPRSDYVVPGLAWLGWERPTRGKPYASKNFFNRCSAGRGVTFIVKANKADITELTGVK